MAVARTAPKCPKCGKVAEGVYRDQSHLPMNMRTIGDTFLYWKTIDCDCVHDDILSTTDREFVEEQMKKIKPS